MTENKRFNVFDVDGTIFLEDHKEGSYHIGEIGNVDVNCLNDIADRLNELSEENEKLKMFLKAVNEELDLANRDCDILEEENEKLKQGLNEDLELIGQLQKKNEQLEQRIKVLEDTVDDLAGTIAHFDLDEVMWNE